MASAITARAIRTEPVLCTPADIYCPDKLAVSVQSYGVTQRLSLRYGTVTVEAWPNGERSTDATRAALEVSGLEKEVVESGVIDYIENLFSRYNSADDHRAMLEIADRLAGAVESIRRQAEQALTTAAVESPAE